MPTAFSTRLLHLTTIPESLGFLKGHARHMRQWGIEMHALSSPGPELESFGVREGVQVYAVQMERRITPLRDIVALVQISRVLRKIRPRIVHAHTPKAGLLGMLAAWLARIPVRIYHLHGLRFVTESGARRALLRWTERISCLLANRVLCVSASLREVAISERLSSAGKIRTLLNGSINGIDEKRFQPPDATARSSARTRLGIPQDAFVVGFIGRVVRQKGIGELAEAWRMLRESFADLRLLVVGPIESEDPVPPGVIDGLRSDPRVCMRGIDWDTPPLYAAMNLFVLPSYREGFPSTLLEASAMGLPVVATNIPGCIDAVVANVTGTLVPPRDVSALIEAVLRYRTDELLRQRHGEAGRARIISDFRQDAVWDATRAEYASMLARRGLFEVQFQEVKTA